MTTPADLGLPAAKFPAYRPGQLEAACDIAASSARFPVLSGRPGAGKTLIYMTAAKLLGARALVLTPTRQLQTQLLGDFRSIGLVDVRGHSNYACALPGAGRWEPPCRYPRAQCLQRADVERARKSDLVVSNYAYWLTLGRQGERMAAGSAGAAAGESVASTLGDFDLLVLDEGHASESWLTQWCRVEIVRDEVRAALGDPGLNVPLAAVSSGNLDGCAEWAANLRPRVSAHYRELKAMRDEAKAGGRDTEHLDRSLARLSALGVDLRVLADVPLMATRWVVERVPSAKSLTIRWTPVWPRDYAEEYLFRGVPKVLFSSATIQPGTVTRHLGIDDSDTHYREVPSTFPVSRRPVYYVSGTQRVDRRITEEGWNLWASMIDRWLMYRDDRRSVVHTKSYDRARRLLSLSRFAGSMLTHRQGDSADTARAVARFRAARPPAVLVSPSVGEGHDFPDDVCRLVVIAKIPFPDSRDAVTAARLADDREYGNYVAAQEIEQMAGRGMRNASDWCEIAICDGHWEWFKRAAAKFFSASFRAAWRWVDEVPEALELEEVA